jgi:hypothetical protein
MKFSQWWMWRRSFRMSDEPREESARPTNFIKRSVILVGKSSSSKSTLGRDFHKLFHLLDRREVQTACMVGRNQSMWRTSASDNALILWTTCWRFEFESICTLMDFWKHGQTPIIGFNFKRLITS